MSDDTTLAERFVAAMGGDKRQVILRFPCACVIASPEESCAHVDAADAARAGELIDAANRRASEQMILNRRASKNDRYLARRYLGLEE